MTPTVVALQTSRHGEPQQRNSHPKTQVPTLNLGHPQPLATFTRRGPVISSPRFLCQQCAHPGPPAQQARVGRTSSSDFLLSQNSFFFHGSFFSWSCRIATPAAAIRRKGRN